MNSETSEVKISDIIIEDRFRKDFGNEKQTTDSDDRHGKTLEDLAQSIDERGLLQPIGITRDNRLVFGERRLMACRDVLGRDTITAHIIPVNSMLLDQVEENTLRKDYTVFERVAIVEALMSFQCGGDRKSDHVRSGEGDTLTVDQAAKKVGFGKDSYYRAKEVKENGSTELKEAVESNRVSLTAANYLVNKATPEEQAEVVAGDKKLTEPKVKSKLRKIQSSSPDSTLDERRRLLELNEEDPELGLVYTPPEVADFIFGILKDLKPNTVLDVASRNGALNQPWQAEAEVKEYEVAYGQDFFECLGSIDADLVVCNPPLGQEQKFLSRIIKVTSPETPIVLVTSYTLRMGADKGGARWKAMRELPDITSIISLPKDVFRSARHPTEVLIFRGESLDLKPHYFLCGGVKNEAVNVDSQPIPTKQTIDAAAPANIPKVAVPMLEACSVTQGDCRKLIRYLPNRSIDLCVTSPPYAERRKDDYPSVPEDKYCQFTLDWMSALRPKLTRNGSVLINIDAHVKDGVVSDYVLKMQLALREAGWYQHRTQIWVKGTVPMGRTDWPRHDYEEVLWLSRTSKPFSATRAAGRYSRQLPINYDHGSRPHKGENVVTTGIARVTDVIDISVGNNENGIDHPARFPVLLAERLIKTFCPKGGTVLDNFCGSGSALIAAKKLNRDYYGFERMLEYVELSRERINKARVNLPVTFVDAEDEGLSQNRSCDTDAS